MVVDAMDLVSAKGHITTFVICSGDSDFSPLVSKLKENDKSVIGVGVKNSTSNLLISNCDEFIFYEDLVRETRALPSIESLPKKKQEVFRLVLDSLQALLRENYDVIWGSMVKQTMQRKQPYFNESYYGYKSFSELLEDAERNGLLTMKKDVKSGGYVVSS
jgi:NYN domain-containing protein/OST-HTH/LOTUS domain-containing protein